jgi:hypothetical protein
MADQSKKQRPLPTPKAPKPWDVPRAPKNGDAEPSAIFHSVGGALDSWNNFENICGALFSDFNEICIGGEASHRAWGSVNSFRARAEMLSAAAEVYFHKYPHSGDQLRFKWMMERALGLSARRNEIAHGVVSRYRWFVPKRIKGVGIGYVLGPSMFSTRAFLA